MQHLGVFFHNALVGMLSYNKGQLAFTYASNYLNMGGALPLSTSMPLQKELNNMVKKVVMKAGELTAELNTNPKTASDIYSAIITIIKKQCAQVGDSLGIGGYNGALIYWVTYSESFWVNTI